MPHKSHLAGLYILTLLAFMPLFIAGAAPDNKPHTKIPVIFDTDIGGDIDDTWALRLLLKSPEFDIKLILSDYPKHPAYQKTTFRAKVIAKTLETAGRTDIPVGLGADHRRFYNFS